MARALSFNGLANAQMIVGAERRGACEPLLSPGDTVRAWSEVLDKAETDRAGRRRAPAAAGGDEGRQRRTLKGEDGKYLPDVLLDLDYWALMPVWQAMSEGPVPWPPGRIGGGRGVARTRPNFVITLPAAVITTPCRTRHCAKKPRPANPSRRDTAAKTVRTPERKGHERMHPWPT